jgi:hypothetical protein
MGTQKKLHHVILLMDAVIKFVEDASYHGSINKSSAKLGELTLQLTISALAVSRNLSTLIPAK